MSVRITSDPSELLRKVEKALLMLRFFWRFPRRHGAWPKYEFLKPWLAALAPATVVDVGVNAGQFLHLAQVLYPKAALVGIEPAKTLCDKLARIHDGDARVTLHCCAAGSAEGEAEFFVTAGDQNSSTHRPGARFELVRTEKVPAHRLDGLLGDASGPMLVKIDVQGAEMEVLEGLGERIGDFSVLIIEAPFEQDYQGAGGFDDIYAFLTQRGLAYRGALGQLNAVDTGHVRQEDSVYIRRDFSA